MKLKGIANQILKQLVHLEFAARRMGSVPSISTLPLYG